MVRQSIVLFVLGFAALFGVPASPQDIAPTARVGIVLPKAQLGQGNTGQDVAEPVRQLIMSFMAGPVLELVPLQARIPAQVAAEAESQNCTHLLYTSVEQKIAGKGMGSLLGKLGIAAGMLSGVGALGAMSAASDAMVAGAATQMVAQATMQSVQEDAIASLTQAQAGSVKARDEITLSYQFVTVGGARPPLEATLNAKAKSNGENLLGPLIEQVATIAVESALAQ